LPGCLSNHSNRTAHPVGCIPTIGQFFPVSYLRNSPSSVLSFSQPTVIFAPCPHPTGGCGGKDHVQGPLGLERLPANVLDPCQAGPSPPRKFQSSGTCPVFGVRHRPKILNEFRRGLLPGLAEQASVYPPITFKADYFSTKICRVLTKGLTGIGRKPRPVCLSGCGSWTVWPGFSGLWVPALIPLFQCGWNLPGTACFPTGIGRDWLGSKCLGGHGRHGETNHRPPLAGPSQRSSPPAWRRRRCHSTPSWVIPRAPASCRAEEV